MRKLYIILSLLVALNSTNVQAQSMEEKLEAKYGWACEHTDNGQKWYSVQKDGKEGACDKNGKELIPPEYDDVRVDYDDKYIKAKKNNFFPKNEKIQIEERILTIVERCFNDCIQRDRFSNRIFSISFFKFTCRFVIIFYCCKSFLFT